MTIKSKLSDLFKGYFSAKTREEKEGYLRQIHLLINRDYFLDEKYLNSYMEVKNRDELLQTKYPANDIAWNKEEDAETVSTSSKREVMTLDEILQATKRLVDAVTAGDLDKTKEAIVHVILNGKQSLLEKAQSTNPEIVSELKNHNKEYPKTFPTKVSDFSSEQIESGKNVSH